MCGRYALTDVDALPERYALKNALPALRPNFNAAPTQTMPIIIDGNGANSVQLMRWGIPRFIGPGKVKDVFNTRADKAFWSWKKLTMSQRVLVPASGFYEWKAQTGGKQPYYIHPKNQSVFSFAGIWNHWKNDDGQEVMTFSIMTTDPNHEMSAIHNRMPVILRPDDEAAWLSPANDNDHDALAALLTPYADGGLNIYAVSKDVNVVRTNDERLLLPLNSQ